jgi:hypothetical protein
VSGTARRVLPGQRKRIKVGLALCSHIDDLKAIEVPAAMAFSRFGLHIGE